MMGSRKGIPNKTTRYDIEILPRLSDIKEWIMQGDAVRTLCKNLIFLQTHGIGIAKSMKHLLNS